MLRALGAPGARERREPASVASSAWELLLRLADSWRGAAVVFVVGFAAYWLEALAWPLQRGRDSWDYWLYYLQLGDAHPPFSDLQLFRTPITPLVTGLPMAIGGGRALELVMSLIYAGAVVAWAWAARPFGRRAAVLMAVIVLVLQLPYAALFHEVSSDFLFGALLAVWSGTVARAAFRPSWPVLACVGVGASVLTLTRPAGQVVVIAAAAAALVAPGRLRQRAARLTVTVVAAAVVLAAWAGVNAARYGELTVARGGKAWVPFYKVFNEGHIAADNGPASRRLATAIEQHVLTLPRYRRLHVDVHTYLDGPSNLESIRLIALSDQVFGRRSNYDVLYDAAVEAIRRHPGTYLRSFGSTFWHFITQRFALLPVHRAHTYPPVSPIRVIDGRPTPDPIVFAPLVEAVRYGFVWCPTADIDRCVLRDPARAFPLARDQRRYVQLVRRIEDWNQQLPLRSGTAWLASRLDTISWNTPQEIVWIALGLVAVFARRPRGYWALLVLLGAAALVLVVHAASQQPQSEYELPLAPLFVLVAVAGLLGPRDEGRSVSSPMAPG